jgi:hypothetical protein
MIEKKFIIVIVQKEEEKKRFETIFSLTDFSYSFVKSLNEAFNKINEYKPFALIISENIWPPVDIYISEIKRYFNDIPIIVALKAKDIVKKEKYLSEGLYVMDFPHTEIDLINIIRTIDEKKEEKVIEKEKKLYTKYFLPILILFFLLTGLGIYITGKTQKEKNKTDTSKIVIPSRNISGFFYNENKLYIYDWFIQSFYIFDEKKDLSIKSFITKDILKLIKDSSESYFFAVNDENEIEKINKKDLKILSTKKTEEKIKDLCFDGAYIWILTDSYLIKSLNNDEITEINRYILSEQLKQAEYIGCDKDDKIVLYTPSKIIITSSQNPNEILKTIIPPEFKVLSFDYRENKLKYILELHEKSIYTELPLY